MEQERQTLQGLQGGDSEAGLTVIRGHPKAQEDGEEESRGGETYVMP